MGDVIQIVTVDEKDSGECLLETRERVAEEMYGYAMEFSKIEEPAWGETNENTRIFWSNLAHVAMDTITKDMKVLMLRNTLGEQ